MSLFPNQKELKNWPISTKLDQALTPSLLQQTQTQQTTQNDNSSSKFKIFEGKEFWLTDKENHQRLYDSYPENDKRCCFNHILKLPKKEGESPKPVFDYELEIVDTLNKSKDVWIKKSRGLGVTELLLRYMIWLAVRNNVYSNSRFMITTGPRINLAEEMINRIYHLFDSPHLINLQKTIKRSGATIFINGVNITAYPSHTVSTMRGYTDCAFILIDEAAFFAPGQQEECRHVAEGYRAKSRPWIVVVSTPYKPIGFFYDIDREENSIYTKVSMHYTRGLGKIYDEALIEKEKQQYYFAREFCLAYSTGTGNTFEQHLLDVVEQKGIQYRTSNLNNPSTRKSCGIDPGFGSSQTAIVITEFIDGLIHVIYSKQFAKQATDEMVLEAYNLIKKYNLNNGVNKVFIDGSNPGFIRSLKKNLGEHADYDYFIEKSKRDDIPLWKMMNIVPVNFSTDGPNMLGNLHKWIGKELVAIDPLAHSELIQDLQMATSDEDMKLDKHDMPMDLLDSMRLATLFYVS